MTEMYGSYSDEDLNEWERMPQNIRVLTSSAFGAWLLRRDKNIKEQEPKTDVLDKIREEINNIEICGQVDFHTSFIRTGEQVKDMTIEIIDKYKAESEDI